MTPTHSNASARSRLQPVMIDPHRAGERHYLQGDSEGSTHFLTPPSAGGNATSTPEACACPPPLVCGTTPKSRDSHPDTGSLSPCPNPLSCLWQSVRFPWLPCLGTFDPCQAQLDTADPPALGHRSLPASLVGHWVTRTPRAHLLLVPPPLGLGPQPPLFPFHGLAPGPVFPLLHLQEVEVSLQDLRCDQYDEGYTADGARGNGPRVGSGNKQARLHPRGASLEKSLCSRETGHTSGDFLSHPDPRNERGFDIETKPCATRMDESLVFRESRNRGDSLPARQEHRFPESTDAASKLYY